MYNTPPEARTRIIFTVVAVLVVLSAGSLIASHAQVPVDGGGNGNGNSNTNGNTSDPWPGPPTAGPTLIGSLQSILSFDNLIDLIQVSPDQGTLGPLRFGHTTAYPAAFGVTAASFKRTIEGEEPPPAADLTDNGSHVYVGPDGLPGIGYLFQGLSGTLPNRVRFAKCADYDCSGAYSNTTVYDLGIRFYEDALGMVIPSDNLPFLVVYDDAQNPYTLYLIKCKTAACTGANPGSNSWHDPQVTVIASADTNSIVGDDGDVSVIVGPNGHPLIAFIEETTNPDRIIVITCGSASCSNSNYTTRSLAFGANDVLDEVEVTLIDGKPTLAFIHDLPSTRINGVKIVQCTGPANDPCSAIGTVTELDKSRTNDSTIVDSSDLAITASQYGNPIVAYEKINSGTIGELRVATCSTPDCSGAGAFATTTIALTDGTDEVSIITPPDSLPVIAYENKDPIEAYGILYVATCRDPLCATGAIITIADSEDDSGKYNSIAVAADGMPVIVYDDDDSAQVELTKCMTPTCIPANYNIGAMGSALDVPSPWFLPVLPTAASSNVGVYGYANTDPVANTGVYGYSPAGVGVAGEAVEASQYGGLFHGPIQITTSGGAPGSLNIIGTLAPSQGLSVPASAPYPSVHIEDDSSPFGGIQAVDKTSGSPESGVSGPLARDYSLGVSGYSQNEPGIVLESVNWHDGILAYSAKDYAAYAYADTLNNPALLAELTHASLVDGSAIEAASMDRAIWTAGSRFVSGGIFQSGNGHAGAVTVAAGTGILACGTSHAAHFEGNVFVKHSLQTGGTETYIEDTALNNDTIIGKTITPEITFKEADLLNILTACDSDPGAPGDCSS